MEVSSDGERTLKQETEEQETDVKKKEEEKKEEKKKDDNRSESEDAASESSDDDEEEEKETSSPIRTKIKRAIILMIVLYLSYQMYVLNGRTVPSLECLNSLMNRCNSAIVDSWLAGTLWHTCSDYCHICGGSSFGVCTSSSIKGCYDGRDWSRYCFCYGSNGMRSGRWNCWV